jgi:4-amino-4-deoxy-L-arabinose transferase-like glycosyltransferase
MNSLRRLRNLLYTRPWRERLSLLLVAVLLLAGLGLRLIDLTDQPLDFHADRQLRGAIIARGMLYQMQPAANAPLGFLRADTWRGAQPLETDPSKQQTAVNLWHSLEVFEPQAFERLVALTYRLLGAEVLWVARLYAILFWLLGGWALYLLSRRLVSHAGGVLSLAAYLFLPLGVQISRAFQPEALMVCLVLWAAYAAARWTESHTWRFCLLTGLFAGLAVYIKAPAAFVLAPLLVLAVLSTWGVWGSLRRPQVWAAALLTILLGAGYYLANRQFSSGGYLGFWSESFRYMIYQPWFYVRWLSFLDGSVIRYLLFFASLAGLALFEGKGRALAAGMWVGYGIFGLTVPYLISTHDYYSALLIPTAALSLAPLAAPLQRVAQRQPTLWRVVFYGVLIATLASAGWNTRSAMLSKDYRSEGLGWQAMGRALPTDGKIIGLTHEYGYRLRYYGWTYVAIWPSTIDQAMTEARGGNEAAFAEEFARRTEGYSYFLVTLYGDLNAQPQLKDKLEQNFPILADGEGYTLFDLR